MPSDLECLTALKEVQPSPTRLRQSRDWALNVKKLPRSLVRPAFDPKRTRSEQSGCHRNRDPSSEPGACSNCWLSLPIKRAKSYSLTLDVEGMDERPRIPLIEKTMNAAITPLDNRLRMTSTVEFAGCDKRIDPHRSDRLFFLLADLDPRIALKIDRSNTTP